MSIVGQQDGEFAQVESIGGETKERRREKQELADELHREKEHLAAELRHAKQVLADERQREAEAVQSEQEAKTNATQREAKEATTSLLATQHRRVVYGAAALVGSATGLLASVVLRSWRRRHVCSANTEHLLQYETPASSV